VDTVHDETERAARLLDAEAKALDLFAETERRGLIAAGQREKAVSDGIRDLANEMFGVRNFWHKRIVRSGPNTLHPYRENPPDRTIEDDDIVFCDFGPIFAEWEADFGRTFVLGDDPVKLRLRDDLPVIFEAGRHHFAATLDITGEQLFSAVVELTEKAGWELRQSAPDRSAHRRPRPRRAR
jgi:Xaa-Pro aminopeptidase